MWIVYHSYLLPNSNEFAYYRCETEQGMANDLASAWFPVQDTREAPAELTKAQFRAARKVGLDLVAKVTKSK